MYPSSCRNFWNLYFGVALAFIGSVPLSVLAQVPTVTYTPNPICCQNSSPFSATVLTGGVYDLAVDYNAQILYEADAGANLIRLLNYQGTQQSTLPTSGAALNDPRGIALDGLGNLYAMNRLGVQIYKINIATGVSTLFATIPGSPGGRYLYVDPSGNIYAGTDLNGVYEYSAAGAVLAIIGTGGTLPLNAPDGMWKVGLDLNMCDGANDRIVDFQESSLNSYSYPTNPIVEVTATGPLPLRPFKMWRDLSGSYYVANNNNGYVVYGVTAGVWSETYRCTNATLNAEYGIAVDESGSVYNGISNGDIIKIAACSNEPTLTPQTTGTATNTASITPTVTPTYTITNTATATSTNTATNSPTSTTTNTSTNSATNTPTSTATNTATATATQTATNSVTNTATTASTSTATNTATITTTYTFTESVTNTATNTASSTATNTATITATQTATNSTTNTATSTATNSATNTATVTSTFTPTNTFTITDTLTITNTPTKTFTATQTYTPTNSPTITFTPTITPTANFSGLFISKNVFTSSSPVSIAASITSSIGIYDLSIYNSAGEHIKTLDHKYLTGPFESGYLWNGSNSAGNICATGVYIVYLTEPAAVKLGRVVFIH